MTTTMTDTAALASIGAATRELRLPVVRADAAHMAEVASVWSRAAGNFCTISTPTAAGRPR